MGVKSELLIRVVANTWCLEQICLLSPHFPILPWVYPTRLSQGLGGVLPVE